MPTQPVYDPARGEAAFGDIRDRADALEPADVQRPNADLFDSGLLAITVAALANDADLRARFERLPAEEFDITHVDILETLGWAALYVQTELLKAAAGRTEAKLPAALVAEAVTVKGRMQTAAEYYLGDRPDAGPEVAAIRSGTGYRDLANDLFRLADLYRAHLADRADDQRSFRSADADEARRLGDRIVAELAATEPNAWKERAARVWTLLRRSYDEVRAAAQWLFRAEPERVAGFPSLYAHAGSRTGAAEADLTAIGGTTDAG